MSETELIEARLRDFLVATDDDADWGEVLHRAATLPPAESTSDHEAAERDHLLRDRMSVPRMRRPSRRVALGGIGTLATAGAIAAVLVVVFGGAGAQDAFAGWTASPTPPASGQTASALSDCTSRLAEAAPVAATDWKPLVIDTRGPFTAVILQGTDASGTCLTGPSFTTADVNLTRPSGSLHILSVGDAHQKPPTVSVIAPNSANSDPISLAEQEQTSVDGQPYTLLQGQVQPGVTVAVLLLSDGTQVQATVANGSIVAWWPSNANATSAQLTSDSGVTTQQLALMPISHPYTFTPISGQSTP